MLIVKHKFIPFSFLTPCSQKQHCTMNEQHMNSNNILQLLLLKLHFTVSNVTCIYLSILSMDIYLTCQLYFELWTLLNSKNEMFLCNNLAGTCRLQFQYTIIFPTDQTHRTGAQEKALHSLLLECKFK